MKPAATFGLATAVLCGWFAYAAPPAGAVITIGVAPPAEMAETDSAEVPVWISSDSAEEISAVDLYLQIGDGETLPAPVITAVNLLDHSTLTDPIFTLASSSQVAYGDPWDVANGTSTGLKPAFAVFCNAATGPSADVPIGLFSVLAWITIETNNTPVGGYPISFTSLDLGVTLVAKTTGTLVPGIDYVLQDNVIFVGPEPSSWVLGVLAALGLFFAPGIRCRRRA